MRPWQLSPSCPPYLLDMTMWSCSTSILHSCPSFPEPQTGFLLLRIWSRNTWQCVLASAIRSSPSGTVTPYKRLGKISDILHLNNENNQLKRRAQPPKDVPLDAQSWTWASCLSSRVAAVTTTTYASWRLSREFHNRFITELPSRVLSRAERTLEECFL